MLFQIFGVFLLLSLKESNQLFEFEIDAQLTIHGIGLLENTVRTSTQQKAGGLIRLMLSKYV